MEHEMLNSKGVTRDEVKEYLDELRESGETNMFGAGAYLRREFNFTQAEAHAEVGRWMTEFGK
jgi:hypothetical protein